MTSSDDSKTLQATGRRGLTLRTRLLLPFLTTLLLLAIVTGSGSVHIFNTALALSADDRLRAAQEVLYREFKKQETILETYISFLQQFQSLVHRYPDETEVGLLQDRLFNTLEKSDISVAFYPIDSADLLPIASLQDLFEQARRSGEPRFRYTDEFSAMPVLMVAAPLFENGEATQIIVLQTNMGGNFLHQATSPLGVRSSLHRLDGKILCKSDPDATPLTLSEEQLIKVSSGTQLFLGHKHPGSANHRHLLAAIPLGSSDLVFLSLEAFPEDSTLFMDKWAIQITVGIMISLFLGGLLYFKAASNVIRPIREIQNAIDAIARGNLGYRIHNLSDGELGELSSSFNRMAESLKEKSASMAATETNQELLQQQTRSQLLLEKKEKELDKITNELRTHQRETAAMLQLNQAMISAPDLDSLFDRILQVLNEALACEHIVLLLYNPGESILEVARSSGIENGLLDSVGFTFDQGICGKVAQDKQLIYVGNVEQDSRNLNYHGQLATHGSLVSAPLVVKGQLIGVLNLHKNETEGFATSELKLIQATANQAAIAINNVQLFERSRDLSNIDTLTGLANRHYFQEVLKREVAQARRFKSLFATVMCDIDNFRNFNEVHGRMRGDALLRQIGQTLLKSTRGIDLVSRFGNKQFVILLPKTDKDGAVTMAEKLRQTILNENFFGEEQSQPDGKLTMSFGVTEFPSDSKNIYELLTLADRALYAAKQQGRNKTVAWDASLEEAEA